MNNNEVQNLAWLVSVNMGYGHQRTAFPLKHLAKDGKMINANDYIDMPKEDRNFWLNSQKWYEAISRTKRIPLIGNTIFNIYDSFQKILSYYPKRDLSKPSLNLKTTYPLIKRGWGKDLILKLKKCPIPIITTFYIPAFMAEVFKYPNEIFCVVCDADVARHWAPLNPSQSRIKYFAPTMRVAERLRLYKVKEENIYFTGYPLPKENFGRDLEVLKSDLSFRLLNLDPQKRYFENYKELVYAHLIKLSENPDHILTILFSVGGAGAQKEIGIKILKSLGEKIKNEEVKLILSAGMRKEVRNYFLGKIRVMGFEKHIGSSLEILFEKDIENYFSKFNESLRKTDILWTKPSELSFYSALGLPIIIAPPIGSQEEFNQEWLINSGFGIKQNNPDYTNEWLFDYIQQGFLAEMAMEGFVEGKKLGTSAIEEIIRNVKYK